MAESSIPRTSKEILPSTTQEEEMDNWRHFNVDGHKETNTVNMRKEEYDEIKRKYKNR